MNVSVAVTKNWGIGYENKLLFHIKEDLQRFKNLTTGKTVVMGHGTLKSLPKSQPLPNRDNIVLSKNKSLIIPDAVVCNSVDSLMEMLKPRNPDDIFIIGGEAVYSRLLSKCTTAYVTKIYSSPPADKFFPNLDSIPGWNLSWESDMKQADGVSYKFCVYSAICAY